MKNGHWVYMSPPPPLETVHMVNFGDEAKTLCGMATYGWHFGDETISGIAATCGRCLRAIGRVKLEDA